MPRRDERSGILIGAGGMLCSDWPEREAIDSTRAGTSDSSYLAAIGVLNRLG